MTTGNDSPHPAWPAMLSRLPGLAWPAIPGQQGLVLATLLTQLEQSQWWPVAALEAAQQRQLRALLGHARRHSPFHARRLEGFRPEARASLAEWLAQIPVMRREDLQSRRAEIDCSWYPPEHGETTEGRSTGSTGEPVVVRRTSLCGLIWMAMTVREHLWQRRDFSATLAIIRANLSDGGTADQGTRSPDWGSPVNQLFASGPAHALKLQTDIERQVGWLRGINPDYLLTYPNNLAALLDFAEQDPATRAGLARVRQMRSIGETLPDSLRARCREILGIGIADVYSTQEIGVITIQCPEAGAHHTMSESLIVEILDDDDAPCAPGDRGRIVVTDLDNFATPLIRYDLGDLAEAGAACSCGRGLPTIARILGRQRNLLRLPDGQRFWPLVGSLGYRDIAPVRQCQVIQRSLERVSLRLAVERPLTTEEEAALAERLTTFLGHRFAVDFEYCGTTIPRGPGGKFEDFVCAIDDATRLP